VSVYNYNIFNLQTSLFNLPIVIRIIVEYPAGQKNPNLEPGCVVSHKIYDYRGVIVHKDSCFQGDENWYLSNHTQPSKQQTWYFVLVDGKQHVTYVAESNLVLDENGKNVIHPMIKLFFSGYQKDLKQYIRNEIPWNPGSPPHSLPPSKPPHSKPPNFPPPKPPISS